MTCFLMLCLAASLSAQAVGGRVADSYTGAPLSGALITLASLETGAIDSVKTGADGAWSFTLSGISGEAAHNQPVTAQLYANYPNPFNPATTILFTLPRRGVVRLTVYNTRGQLVDEANALLGAGSHRILWHSRGAAGLYLYTLHFEQQILHGKMIQLDAGSGDGLGLFTAGEFPAGSREASTLNKKQSGESYEIVLSCFGYCADTLQVLLAGGEYYDRALESIHRRALVVDLHNDILERIINDASYHLKDRHTWWQTDLPRMKMGGIDLQLFAVWVDPSHYGAQPFNAAMNMIDRLESEVSLTGTGLQQVRHPEEINFAAASEPVQFVIGVEGGHVIEDDLEKLYTLYHRGMRLLTITWNNSTNWATSCEDANKNSIGLSEFGRRVVRACDSLGIIIDVSHVGPKTVQDILATSRNPIVASHSGADALRSHRRNLTDEQIIAIARSGGVVGVIFYPAFIAAAGRPATISTVIAHIDHIVQLAGIDYVALGSDFDGVNDSLPTGLKQTSDLPNLTMELLKHGYTREEVEKILGRNFLRVFNTVCL
jgi:membrane dipeptidase